MFDLKENSARFGKCQHCETSCEHVCWTCKAWYCSDLCIAIDWDKHKNYCKPRTVHIDNYEKCIQNSNCYLKKGDNGSSVTEAKDDVKTSKETTPPIPSDKYTKIVISWIDEPIYWAFRLDDAEAQTIIEAKLDVYCNSTRAKKISQEDNKCCAPFDGAWFRAKIMSKSEDMAVVRFIDFGNDAFIKLSKALIVPEELQLVEPLAFQVKFPYGKPNTITLNVAFDVKAIKMDGDICEVEVLGYTKKSETSSVPDVRPPTVSAEDSSNVHDRVEINDTSTDKSDLQIINLNNNILNNQQRQDSRSSPSTLNEKEKVSTEAETPLICSLPSTLNEKEKVSTKAETPLIPTDKFTKIVVSWIEEPIYWVYRFDDVETQSKIEEMLNVHCTSIRAKRISLDDNICCALFDGAWYRAKILSTDGVAAVVKFIDFGNDASIKLSETLKVPEQLKLFRPLAFKVRFTSEKPNSITINSAIDVKAIKQDGDTFEVQIQGYPIKIEEALPIINLPSPSVAVEGSFNRHDGAVTNSNSAGTTDHNYKFDLHQDQNKMTTTNEKLLEITSKVHTPYLPTDKLTKIAVTWIDDSFCWAFRFEDFNVHCMIEQILRAYCTSSHVIRISPDDNTCCAPFEGGWYRATILSKDNNMALVRFIDYGNESFIKLDEALKVPKELLVFEPLAFKVRFMGGKPNITINDVFDVKAVKQNGDILEVQIQGYKMKSETLSVIGSSPSTVSVHNSSNKLYTFGTKSTSTETAKKNANEYRNLSSTCIDEIHTKTFQSAELNKQSINHDDLSHINVLVKTTCSTDDHKVLESVKFHNIPPIPTDRFSKVNDSSNKLHTFGTKSTSTETAKKNANEYRNLSSTCIDEIHTKTYQSAELNKQSINHDDLSHINVLVKTTCSTDDHKVLESVKVHNIPPIPTDRFSKISDKIVLPQANGVKTQDIPKETMSSKIPDLHYSPKRRNNHLIYQIEPSLSTVSVQAQMFIGENCTTGFILVDDTLKNISSFKSIKEIAKELSTTNADPEFKPSLKDEVCVRIGGIWYRGIVTLINPDKTNVALVDIGVIVVPDALAPLPQHLKLISETAVRCIFSTSQKMNRVGEQIVLQNLKIEPGKLTGDSDKFGQVAIIPWDPTCEDAGLISENIKSEIQYKLTAFYSPNEIYLQSKEQNQTIRLKDLIRDVATYSLKAPLLIRKPWCGQLVSCLSPKNNMYCRAQVLKKIGDRYEVKYIDSGLVETVSLTNLKPLSDKLKSIPCFVTKAGLKGIPGSSLNNEAIKIMNQLMDEDSLITVAVENNDPTKIRLFEGKKDINKHIYEAMLPSWSSRNTSDSVIFMSNDIMYEKWLNGQNMRLAIVSVKAFNEIVVLNEQSEVFTHVVSMTTIITNFCSSDRTPYNPRVQEMCLAKFQDEIGSNWYRALCCASYENSATVYLIDFGNFSELPHTDIRKIPPEFMDFPTASKTCKIYGLSDGLPDDIKEDIANVYTDNHLDSMVVCDNNDGSAVLYVPKLMDIIAQNNLTSISPPPTPFLMPAHP